jgi:hypothetical protein
MKYTKTETGQLAFKVRSPVFSARQRSMFILFDGNKTVAQVLAATVGLGAVQADIDQMVENGFLALVLGQPATTAANTISSPQELASSAAVEATPAEPSNRSAQQRYTDAKPLATQLTAGLGLRGFMLNISVESAAGYEELLALFPKIQAAVGTKASKALEAALKS